MNHGSFPIRDALRFVIWHGSGGSVAPNDSVSPHSFSRSRPRSDRGPDGVPGHPSATRRGRHGRFSARLCVRHFFWKIHGLECLFNEPDFLDGSFNVALVVDQQPLFHQRDCFRVILDQGGKSRSVAGTVSPGRDQGADCSEGRVVGIAVGCGGCPLDLFGN